MPPIQFLPLSQAAVTGTVMARFRAVAAALPDVVAVLSSGAQRTFAQLDAESDALAAALSAGDAFEQPLAMLLDHDVVGIVGLLGAMKAGRPVLPLNPLVPVARLQQVVRLAGVRCCLSDARHASVAKRLAPVIATVVDIDSALAAARGSPATAAVARKTEPTMTDAAVILFTSGSTGTPKGVAWTHGTLLNEAYAGYERLGFAPQDRVGLVLPYTFAVGLTVLVFALLNGAGVYMFDPRSMGVRGFPAWIAAQKLTTLHLTPSLLRSLVGALAPGMTLPELRLVTMCSEPVYGADIAAIRPHLSKSCSCVNWCGSSEMGSLAFYQIGAEMRLPQGPIPAGALAAGKEVMLYRDDGTPAPQGETGEVVVNSAFMAAGYWNGDPSIVSRFTVEADGRRTYRSGDLGRFDLQGELTLLGRKDSAVKIRGYLVEPAEVEAALRTSPSVGDAVVQAVPEPSGSKKLIAYVTPVVGEKVISAAGLRRLLREKLPAWMVPATIVWLPTLPRNERGKVDRLALPLPQHARIGVEPYWDWELLVADLWKQVLHLEEVNMADDFAELGGDSLTAAELLSLTATELGVVLQSSALAEAPTLQEFVARVSHAQRAVSAHPTAVSIRTTGSRPPLFCFAGAGGLALNFLSFARRLGDEQPVYAFQAHGLEQRGMPDWSIEANAARHLPMIRRLAPRGPYLLAGHSMGGLIALEIAQQLKMSGEEVKLLAMLDSPLPPSASRPSAGARWDGHTADPERPAQAAETFVGPWLLQNVLRELRLTLAERLRVSHLAKMVRVALSGLIQYPGTLQYRVFYDQGCVLLRLYKPRRWEGRTLFVRAHDSRDPESAWSYLLPHRQMLQVSAVHLSMMNDPHVAEIAAAVRAEIEQALSDEVPPAAPARNASPRDPSAVWGSR